MVNTSTMFGDFAAGIKLSSAEFSSLSICCCAGAGECVEEVAARLEELLARLEASDHRTHLLVAHGDTLSILAALLAGDLPNHR